MSPAAVHGGDTRQVAVWVLAFGLAASVAQCMGQEFREAAHGGAGAVGSFVPVVSRKPSWTVF